MAVSSLVSPLPSSLSTLRLQTAHLTDVKLVCFNGVEWAHRLVLAAASPLLKRLLSEDTTHTATVLLPQLSSSALKLILDYVYTGQMCVAADQLADVVHTLEVLQLKCGVSVSKMGDVKRDEKCVKWETLHDLYVHSDQCQDKQDSEETLQNDESGKFEEQQMCLKLKRESNQEEDEEESSDSENIEEIVDPDDDDSDDTDPTSAIKCVVCTETFESQEVLKRHLQKHLGMRKHIDGRICSSCQRSFRTSLQSELHKRSHELGMIFFRKSGAKALRFMSASQTQRWRCVRVSLAHRRLVVLPKIRDRVAQAMSSIRVPEGTVCGSESLKITTKVRFVLPQDYEPKVRQKQPAKKSVVKRPTQARQESSDGSRKRKSQMTNKVKNNEDRIQRPHQPANKNPKRMSSRDSNDLTCPTCDKSFVAQSIFERHLRTYKHGRYALSTGKSASSALSLSSPSAALPSSSLPPPVPAPSSDVQPRMVLGGREMNKYECHLCNAVFVRVKDLAKHRARICSAWKTMAAKQRKP